MSIRRGPRSRWVEGEVELGELADELAQALDGIHREGRCVLLTGDAAAQQPSSGSIAIERSWRSSSETRKVRATAASVWTAVIAATSGGLVELDRSGGARAPVPREKLVEALRGMVGDAGQHVGEPSLRIDVV